MTMSVYAISDIHGNLSIAKQVVKIANQGNIVYNLGDCCDRGNHGWEIIKMFLTTENIVYLRGNHEDMLMRAMRPYFVRGDDEYRYTNAFETWSLNGSAETEMGILSDDINRARLYFGQLYALHVTADYVNKSGQIIYMCHSGWEYFLRDDYHDLKYYEKIIWERNHYFEPHWKGYDNEYMIHGHTPIPYLIKEAIEDWPKNKDWETGALHYCGGHKIDIDMLTIKSHKACLIDLDTFEEIILEGEE